LDLATTPFALERAQERLKLDITEETPTPLTSFLENYKPYRGQNRLLRAYEARTLKPFIRSATRSQSILIQHDGNLLRRRIQVTPVPEPSYAFYNKIRRKLLGVQNLHRCLEALDLRLDGRLQIEFEEGPGALLGNTFYGKRRLGRGFFIELIAYSIVVWLVVLVTVVVLNVTSLHFEPGPSPGILLSIVGHACRDQGVLQACNKITPNPDVAGIGVRYFSLTQSILPLTF
jgi:hypothetical protein